MGLINTLAENPEAGLILILALVFSLSFHEFAHAYVAYRLGDDTAAHQGRLTLNPLAHLDPMGSLMLLFIGFGYAKPVPVNPMNLHNPRTDMMKVAFAGPASNLLLCLAGCLLMRFIGIDELTKYLNNQIELKEAKKLIAIKTRQYAKRQTTWARSRMIKWTKIEPHQLSSAIKKITKSSLKLDQLI